MAEHMLRSAHVVLHIVLHTTIHHCSAISCAVSEVRCAQEDMGEPRHPGGCGRWDFEAVWIELEFAQEF